MRAAAAINQRRSLPQRELFNIPLDLVDYDKALSYPIYVRVNDRAILFRPEGDQLTTGRASRLREKIDSVGIPKSYLNHFLQSVEYRLADLESGDPSALVATQRLRDLLVALGHSLREEHSVQATTLHKVNFLAGKMAHALRRNPELANSLIRKNLDPAVYHINHNVNVAIYGTLMGIQLGLSPAELKTLTYGCLVHNIGNLFVPDEILLKPGPLTQREIAIVRSHPMRGAELMERFHAPKEVVRMIREHHERIDGQGYPAAASGKEIHLFSKICSIADVYDALTSNRPYKNAITADHAIALMRAMVGKFDPNILKMIA